MERRKPLRRDGPGARRFANSRSALNTRRKATTRRTADPITPEVTDRLRARSGGYCEVRASVRCTGVASHRHHRKLRRHGNHTLENLLHVCTHCHEEIHGHPDVSYARRWLLHSTDDPATMPVIGP